MYSRCLTIQAAMATPKAVTGVRHQWGRSQPTTPHRRSVRTIGSTITSVPVMDRSRGRNLVGQKLTQSKPVLPMRPAQRPEAEELKQLRAIVTQISKHGQLAEDCRSQWTVLSQMDIEFKREIEETNKGNAQLHKQVLQALHLPPAAASASLTDGRTSSMQAVQGLMEDTLQAKLKLVAQEAGVLQQQVTAAVKSAPFNRIAGSWAGSMASSRSSMAMATQVASLMATAMPRAFETKAEAAARQAYVLATAQQLLHRQRVVAEEQAQNVRILHSIVFFTKAAALRAARARQVDLLLRLEQSLRLGSNCPQYARIQDEMGRSLDPALERAVCHVVHSTGVRRLEKELARVWDLVAKLRARLT